MTIANMYENSELSLAAYATLQSGVPDIQALQQDDAGMSEAQAIDFSKRWRVVDQYTHGEEMTYIDEFGQKHTFISRNGLSVTLFEAIGSGQQVVAIRGTTRSDLIDLITDAGISIGLPPEYANQYQALHDQIEKWQDDSVLSPTFTVSGHSLGGWLAAELALQMPTEVEHAYLYNAPGVGGVPAQLLEWSYILAPNVSSTSISSIYGEPGWEGTAQLGTVYGESVPVYIEAHGDMFDDHSIVTLTDALAVYDLLAQLDPGVGLEKITEIIQAASATDSSSLEATIAAVGRVFGEQFSSTETPRDTLYQNIYKLTQENLLFGQAAGLVSIEPLTGKSASDLAGLAASDIAYRYALVHLNRFAITGDDSLYALHNAGGELSLYDPQTDQGSLTRDYLNDRAAFVLAQINLDLNGTQTHAPEAIEYHDLTRAVVITETTTNSADITRRIVFGSEGNDVLDQGGRLADHLYGGKGRDRLSGGDGDDYLEGGQGSDWMDGGIGTDTYFYKPGDGEDTLSDSDGLGVLHIGGHTIAGAGTAHASLEQGTATWVDDAGFRYQLTRNGDLTITGGTLLTDDKVTIKHFDIAQGTLGIQLNNAMLIGIVSCSASNPFKAPDTPAIGVGTDVNNALSIGIASSGASNPFRVPDVPAIGVETDVNEGGAAGLKVVFNRPALSGERLVIGVAGDDAATLSLLSGHGAQMLPDGGLEFLLQPGQTEIRFVVSSIADIAADTRYTLAATVYPADTNEVAATSSHLLTIHDGTYAVLPGSISHSMYGTSGADALHDTNANDSIETGAGDDKKIMHPSPFGLKQGEIWNPEAAAWEISSSENRSASFFALLRNETERIVA